MLQDIRRQKLGKSGSKFRYGGGRYQKRPKKLRRILWTAPFLYTFLYFDKQFALPSITRFIQSNDYFSKLRGYNLLYEPMCDQIQTPLTIVYFLTLHEISPIICKYLGKNVWLTPSLAPHSLLPQAYFVPRHILPQAYFGPIHFGPRTNFSKVSFLIVLCIPQAQGVPPVEIKAIIINTRIFGCLWHPYVRPSGMGR